MVKANEVPKIQTYKQRLGHDINGVRPVMIPDDSGDWVNRHTAEHLANLLLSANKRIAELEKRELPDSVNTKGWGFPALAKKAHYFNAGKAESLCNKWMFTGPRVDEMHDHADNCLACMKKHKQQNLQTS